MRMSIKGHRLFLLGNWKERDLDLGCGVFFFWRVLCLPDGSEKVSDFLTCKRLDFLWTHVNNDNVSKIFIRAHFFLDNHSFVRAFGRKNVSQCHAYHHCILRPQYANVNLITPSISKSGCANFGIQITMCRVL